MVRQLPARDYVDKLIATFFQEVNWHYSPLDKDFFMEQLQNWNSVSFSVLNRGPQDLPGDVRFFPALLFQVLALALQFQPHPHYDPSLNSLKYVSEMSLDDLASDYSESGVGILSLLGKRDITLVTIQAGFLRTSFLKNSGLVTESWHSLGQTIRDAQEIGWHKDPVDRAPKSPEKALEALWLVEQRRRMWLNLQMWDAHMGLILGRPTVIDINEDKITVPIDTPSTINRRLSAPLPRAIDDPPTPLTMLITNTRFLYALREILVLEKEGVHPKDYTKVDQVHQEIVKSIEHLPPFFRSVNPDTTFDDRPDCHWLPAARQLFDTTGAFVIMTLHKPYAFTNSNHRHEALKASLTILRAQRRLFQYLEARHYKLFNLVISTFDAVVLVAAIYILHPTENRQYLSDALQHFDWAMERFEKMSYRNQMAKSALGVLQAIHIRLVKALGRHPTKKSSHVATTQSTTNAPAPRKPSVESPDSNPSSSGGYNTNPRVPPSISSSNSAGSVHPSNSSLNLSDYSATSASTHTSHPSTSSLHLNPNPQALSSSDAAQEWTPYPPNGFPPDFSANNLGANNTFDFSGIAPLQPMHDLLFNDLVGVSDDPGQQPTVAANAQTFYEQGAPWQFEGEFRDDSFWNFMNQYNLR